MGFEIPVYDYYGLRLGGVFLCPCGVFVVFIGLLSVLTYMTDRLMVFAKSVIGENW